MNQWIIWGIVLVCVTIFVFLLVQTYQHLHYRVGPDEALIIYGGRIPRVITNFGTIVTPLLEMAKVIPLAPFPIDVAPSQILTSQDGTQIKVAATVLLHVRDDRQSVLTAAEMVFGVSQPERQTMLRVVVTPYIHQLVSKLTEEQLRADPHAVNMQFNTLACQEFAKFGLETLACSLTSITVEKHR